MTADASSTRPHDAAQRVVDAFQALFFAAQDHRRQAWLHADLTIAQMRAFFAIAKGEPASVGAVARSLRIGLPAVSHLVDRLVQAGLVQRHPHPTDRRVTVLAVSPKGRRLLDDAEESGPKMLRTWLASMEEADVDALARGLTALVRVADASRVEGEQEGRDPA